MTGSLSRGFRKKILMDLAILRGICSLQAEKTFFHGILGGRAAWRRVCRRAKLLAGTLRCLRLCWRLPWDWPDEEQLGRCPKPHKRQTKRDELPPLDPARDRRKGTKSPPLDPSARLSWSRFHAPSACSFLVLRRSLCLLPKLSVKNQKIPRIVRDSGGNAYRSPLRPRLRLTRRTGCPALFFALDAFVRATGLLAGALSTRTGVPPRRILPSLPMTTG